MKIYKKENAEPSKEIIAHYKRLGLSESDSIKAAGMEARLATAFGFLGLNKEEAAIAARGSNACRNGNSSSAFGSTLAELDLLDVERR